jgi:hypothetical protein
MWVGRDPVSWLGYDEWPLVGPVSFCKVWRQVVLKGSSLDFLMHSSIGVPYNWVHSFSSYSPFEFYGCPPIVGLLGSFLTYGGYCCPYMLGRFCGVVGHFEYPGAEVQFRKCLEEWFDQLMLGRLDCVALGDAVQKFF